MIESEWNAKVESGARRGGLAPAEWVQAALAIAMLLLALYGLLQMPAASDAEAAAPTAMVQDTQIAHATDGSLALSCRTVRWCSKPNWYKGPYSVARVERSAAASNL